MSEPVFPTTIAGLATYLFKVVPYLVAQATRLGISTARINALKALYGDNILEGTYVYCKEAYDNASNRKDSLITTNLESISDEIIKKLQEIYNNIPAENWTDADRNITNRKTGLPYKRTTPEKPISELCYVEIKAEGLGLISGGAHFDSTVKKFSMPPSAKQLEIRYAIVQGNFPIPAEMESRVKKTCIGPNDGTTAAMFSKATISIQLDEIFAGYHIKCWGRWIDLSYPEFAGKWSQSEEIMIA